MTTRKHNRREQDSLGAIDVPAKRYWGAQTERARRNFAIGEETMPRALVRALGVQKLAAARVNMALGVLERGLGEAICQAATEVAEGALDEEFPLSVWQSGSGTQSHMNANEVIAGRANEILTGKRGGKSPVHPNDHCNLGQSSNDSFPTAMHIAGLRAIKEETIPALVHLHASLAAKAEAFAEVVKIGRTHLMDATPLTLGQEFSGYAAQVEAGIARLEGTLPHLSRLAQGGTAVGTGLNTVQGFAEAFAAEVSKITGQEFTSAANTFEALAAHDAMVEASGALNTVATSLMKIANDIRLLASGPRAGLGEITLPANEPGSSIMPGKVNPTQAEALAMVAAQVFGNHVTVTVGGASGQLELNVFKPLLIANLLRSARLIGDATRSFADNCIAGIEPERGRIADHLERSLMLVTALTPHIGYDAAARIARKAYDEGTTLRQAALALGLVSAADFDAWVRPEAMLGPAPKPEPPDNT